MVFHGGPWDGAGFYMLRPTPASHIWVRPEAVRDQHGQRYVLPNPDGIVDFPVEGYWGAYELLYNHTGKNGAVVYAWHPGEGE